MCGEPEALVGWEALRVAVDVERNLVRFCQTFSSRKSLISVSFQTPSVTARQQRHSLASMVSLLDRHEKEIIGVISCWDRVIVHGTLPGLGYSEGMTSGEPSAFSHQLSAGPDR